MLVRRKSISLEACIDYVSGVSDTQREILDGRGSSILMGVIQFCWRTVLILTCAYYGYCPVESSSGGMLACGGSGPRLRATRDCTNLLHSLDRILLTTATTYRISIQMFIFGVYISAQIGRRFELCSCRCMLQEAENWLNQICKKKTKSCYAKKNGNTS